MVSKLPLEFLVQKLESLIESVYSEDPDGIKPCTAVNDLDKAAENNFAEFMIYMSVILADSAKYSTAARRGAAFQLKQRLTNKDSFIRDQLKRRWLALPLPVRDSVKSNLLTAIKEVKSLRLSCCSQIVGYVACVEFPITNNWPELIPSLCSLVIRNEENGNESAIEALAFVCKKLKIETLAFYIEDIKTAILTCVQAKKLSKCARLASLICLLECFELIGSLFHHNRTCRLLIAFICDSVKFTNTEIRIGGLGLLVKLATHQYKCLKEFSDSIEQVTIEAIQSDHKRTHIQGLEFWKAVSQVETPRDSEGRLHQPAQDRLCESYEFSKKALPKLVPALLMMLDQGAFVQNKHDHFTLKSQDNDTDPIPCSSIGSPTKNIKESNTNHRFEIQKQKENFVPRGFDFAKKGRSVNGKSKFSLECWIPPKEVIIYLSELCESFPEAIDLYILPHIPGKLKHKDLKERNSALWSMLVFLQQMKQIHAKQVLQYYFPMVVRSAQDESNLRIRNTALWVISWMLDKCPWLLDLQEKKFLNILVNLLLSCISEEQGKIASTGCITLTSLMKASYFLEVEKEQSNRRPNTFSLSPFYDKITDGLVAATNRRLTAAFEALRQILSLAPDDCYWIVLDTVDVLIAQLRQMITLPEVHLTGCRCHETVQQILCAVLRYTVKSLRPDEEATSQLAFKFLECLIDILTLFPKGKAKEDAILTIPVVSGMLEWRVKERINLMIPASISETFELPPRNLC